MTKRPYVGELGHTTPFATLRAEATHWNVMDVLVQMWTFSDGGYIVRETHNRGLSAKTTYTGPDEEEAYRTWLNAAFGA